MFLCVLFFGWLTSFVLFCCILLFSLSLLAGTGYGTSFPCPPVPSKRRCLIRARKSSLPTLASPMPEQRFADCERVAFSGAAKMARGCKTFFRVAEKLFPHASIGQLKVSQSG